MIKELREFHGFTQEGLASLLDVKPDTVRKWEYSINEPSQKYIDILIDYKLLPFGEDNGNI